MFVVEKMLSLKEALEICKQHEREITKSGLYYAGYKNNFISRNGTRLYFNKQGFYDWLLDKNKVPEGFYSIKEISELLDVSFSLAYTLSQNKSCETQIIETRGGAKIYVELKSIEKLVKEHRARYKKRGAKNE